MICFYLVLSCSLDTSDLPAMCHKNAAAAAGVGRMDLVQLWSLAAASSDRRLTPHPDPDRGPPWAVHPFGSKMISSL